MGMIIVLVFVGVFSVVALVMFATGQSAAQNAKQVVATLESALATETPQTREQLVDLRKSTNYSRIPWLNDQLVHLQIAPLLQTLLKQADLKWSAGQLMSMCCVAFAIPAYLVYFKYPHFLPVIGIGLVFGSLPINYVLFKRSRRFAAFEAGLPPALDLMVSALRAGHSLIASMGLIARECSDPIGAEFKACFEEQNFGLEMKTALDNLTGRVPLQDLRIVSTAILIQKESGGNLAEVLDKTAHVIRERFRLKRKIATHTAQGRLSGLILSLLPVVTGFALFAVNPKMMSVLWTNPLGIKLMCTATGMIIVGGLIIRHLVNMDV
jgi:tight adherence protein B